MKKFLLAGVAALLSASAFAQVEVTTEGNLKIGSKGSAYIEDVSGLQVYPTTKSKASIDLGSKYIRLGEYEDGKTYTFNIGALRGMRFASGTDKEIFIYDDPDDKGTFWFNVDVCTSGVFIKSDKRLKKDIAAISTPGSLWDITPVQFKLEKPATVSKKSADTQLEELDAEELKDTKKNANRTRYGFIAQEVAEVFPDLVTTDNNGYLSVDYIGFIPLMLDAMREMKGTIEQQNAEIAALRGEDVREMQAMPSTAEVDALEAVTLKLYQNTPNPFSGSTEIRCDVPEHIAKADIYIYDLQGKQLFRLPVEGRGKTSVMLDAGQLSAGMYVYALIADGKEAGSRRMVLTD